MDDIVSMVVMMGLVPNAIHHHHPRHVEHPCIVVPALAVEKPHAAVPRHRQLQCLKHPYGKLEVPVRPVVSLLGARGHPGRSSG